MSGRPLFGKEPRHEDEVTVASFFDNDKRIVTASKDGTAKVWYNFRNVNQRDSSFTLFNLVFILHLQTYLNAYRVALPGKPV